MLVLTVSVLTVSYSPGPLYGSPSAKARLSSPLVDFGPLEPGARARRELGLENDSDAPLEIRGISTSHPALAATVDPKIPPRSSTQIVLELDATELRGRFSGAVTMITDDPAAQELRVEVEAFIGAQVEVVPKPLLALRAFRWEVAAKERQVELVNRSQGPLEIVTVHGIDRERLELEVKPIEAGQRYRLTARLRADGPAGTAQSGLRVETNKGDVGVMVLTLLKDRVYTIPQTLDFEVIDAGAIARNPDLLRMVTQPLQVYRLGSDDFRVELESAPPFLSVSIDPESGTGVVQPIPDQGPTSIFDVTVTPIPERLPSGPFSGVLRFRTSDSDIKVIEIPVTGRRR